MGSWPGTLVRPASCRPGRLPADQRPVPHRHPGCATRRRGRDPDYRWRTATDAPETDVARSGDEWIAAVRSELAAVEDPRERRHFARAVVVVVVVRRTLTAWTWLLAGCVAAAVTVLSAVAS
jgi:hypothetical protein